MNYLINYVACIFFYIIVIVHGQTATPTFSPTFTYAPNGQSGICQDGTHLCISPMVCCCYSGSCICDYGSCIIGTDTPTQSPSASKTSSATKTSTYTSTASPTFTSTSTPTSTASNTYVPIPSASSSIQPTSSNSPSKSMYISITSFPSVSSSISSSVSSSVSSSISTSLLPSSNPSISPTSTSTRSMYPTIPVCNVQISPNEPIQVLNNQPIQISGSNNVISGNLIISKPVSVAGDLLLSDNSTITFLNLNSDSKPIQVDGKVVLNGNIVVSLTQQPLDGQEIEIPLFNSTQDIDQSNMNLTIKNNFPMEKCQQVKSSVKNNAGMMSLLYSVDSSSCSNNSNELPKWVIPVISAIAVGLAFLSIIGIVAGLYVLMKYRPYAFLFRWEDKKSLEHTRNCIARLDRENAEKSEHTRNYSVSIKPKGDEAESNISPV